MTQQAIPPGYVDVVERMMKLIAQWCDEQTTVPDLQWHDPAGVMFIGALQGDALKHLAASPDSIRLLQWLDDKTDRQGTVFQATIALQLLGLVGGAAVVDERFESPALKRIRDFALSRGTTTKVQGAECPGCHKVLDGASGEAGHTPSVGDLSVCCYCGAFAIFAEGLTLRSMSKAEFDALDPTNRAMLEEMRDLYRSARLAQKKGRRVQA